MQLNRHNFSQMIISMSIIAVFVSVFVLSLFAMPPAMDMSMVGGGCPFMSGENTLCTMSSTDHIDAWKSAFLSISTSLMYILITIVMLVLIVSIAPNVFLKPLNVLSVFLTHICERLYTFSYRALQELFSQGILNPKLF